MRRRTFTLGAAALAVAAASPATAATSSPRPTIALPTGFPPEGIAISRSGYVFAGNRVNGDIYRADLRTGLGRLISRGPGTPSLGMKLDRHGRLFVAGGRGGDTRVIDSRDGALLAAYPLQTGTTLINDVVLAHGSAWYTDTLGPYLYRLRLGPGGRLPGAAETIPLTGDIAYQAGNNANGIAPTPDGRGLIIVQSNTGLLFRVDSTGVTTLIDLGGVTLPGGDGLWLRGRSLYVVQPRDNRITELGLDATAARGAIVTTITQAGFDVPTTIAEHGGRLYLPNARFTTTPAPDTTYSVVSVPLEEKP